MSAGEDMSAGTPLLRGAIAPAGRRVAPNRAPSLCRAGGFGLDSLNGRQHRQLERDPSIEISTRTAVASGGERPRTTETISYGEQSAVCVFGIRSESAHASRALRASALIASRALVRWRTSRRAGWRPRFCRGRCGGAGCGRRGPRREVGRRERRRERTCARATSASEGARRRFCPGGNARCPDRPAPSRRRPGTTTRGRRGRTERTTTPPSMARRSRSRRASL